MPEIIYENFDLLILPGASSGVYRVKVLESSGGGDVNGTFSQHDLAAGANGHTNVHRRLEDEALSEVPPPSNGPISSSPPDCEAAKSFGGRLFNAVFQRDIYAAFKESRHQPGKRKRLRIRINLSEVPELAALPWEYLYDPSQGHFFAKYVDTPVVRYLEHPEAIEKLAVTYPLRVLVLIASPRDCAPLDTEREWANLEKAFESLKDKVQLVRLPRATLDDLRQELMRNLEDHPYHIFHYIGHGEFDPQSRRGALLFEDEDGNAAPVSGQRLGELLHDHGALRLAVINACEGARLSETNIYAGTAQSLLRNGGIPAVIAMQFVITDDAAIAFTEGFYGALAYGYPIDAALSEARKAIWSAREEDVEWATPVLYMRSPDGQIFADRPIPSPAATSRATARPPTGGRSLPASAAPTPPESMPEAHFQNVISALTQGQLTPFLGMDINLYGRQVIEQWDPDQNQNPTLPGASELSSWLAKIYQYPPGDTPSLMEVSQFVAVTQKVGALYNDLDKVFGGGHEPTPLHHFFARLPVILKEKNYPRGDDRLRKRFLIATMNYDDLLERAFSRQLSNYHVIAYVAEGNRRGKFQHFRYAQGELDDQPVLIEDGNTYRGLIGDEAPIILKLPGSLDYSLNRNHNFAITEDHFCEYLSCRTLAGLIPAELTAKLKNSNHLFLGYGLRDWNLRALLYRIWEGTQNPRFGVWAVHPHVRDLDRKYWMVCGVEAISADLANYIGALEERLVHLISPLPGAPNAQNGGRS